MKTKLITFMIAVSLTSCANTRFYQNDIKDVYVENFESENIQYCRPSDVDLSHKEAKEFFLRAKKVEHKVIHDHYDYAPCYIEGTLKYKSTICEWEIRAGATGHITCDKGTQYFVCDTCADLL